MGSLAVVSTARYTSSIPSGAADSDAGVLVGVVIRTCVSIRVGVSDRVALDTGEGGSVGMSAATAVAVPASVVVRSGGPDMPPREQAKTEIRATSPNTYIISHHDPVGI